MQELLVIFKLIADEFKDIGDDTIIAHLTLANNKISSNIPAHSRNEMVAYLAAHQVDISLKRKGSGGQVTSVSEGKLRIDYATNNKVKTEYDLSNYGRRYQDLRDSCVITLMTR